MKKIGRILIYTLLIIIFATLGIIGLMNKPSDKPNQEILNTIYYKYNTTTGEYDELKLTEEAIEYKGEILNLKSCKEYTYTEETGIIKLDCNKAFRIIGHTEEVLVINMDKENHYYYKTKEKSYKGEFQRKFQMSLESYKQEGEKELETIEIDTEDLINILKEKKPSFIYIKGNNCETECTLFNHEFINFSSKNNIHYLNLNKIKEEDEEKIKEIDENLLENLKQYNKEYPNIIVINNSEIKETIKIEGKGFDYSKYRGYADTYEVTNE